MAVLIALAVRSLYIRRYTPEQAWTAISRRGTQQGIFNPGMSIRSALNLVADNSPEKNLKDLVRLRDYLEATRYSPSDPPPEVLRGRELYTLKGSVLGQLSTIAREVNREETVPHR